MYVFAGVNYGALVYVTIDTTRADACLWVHMLIIVLVSVTIDSRTTDTCVQVLLWVCWCL